ncbi:hypothetical protein BZZ01_30870 [Nostocales cyanobacterium HT-58-2]|nr:hypothetical protein BZZ01_30870 [Nostocales cyanobacterium HT-58-2]
MNLLTVIATAANIISRQFFSRATATQPSNYEIFSRSLLFHSEYYPLNQTVNPQLYRPVAEWSGRLILPVKELHREPFVQFEVQNASAAHHNLIGKVVNLKWSHDPKVQKYVKQVTYDVKFTDKARKNQQTGYVHPTRLNLCPKVDPLESLAGARPVDDVCVKLLRPIVLTHSELETELIINTEPIQVTGRFVGLVTIEARTEAKSDFFLVRHYNKATQSFSDGVQEVVRIPQVPEDRQGISRSTNHDIEKSPFNSHGWYIYGAPDATGTFVVQALEPRALLQLQPQQVISRPKKVLKYLKKEMWARTKAQKGKISRVLLAPDTEAAEAISQWCLGDKALVLHLHGAIGGKKAESPFIKFFAPGHFSYGVAEVVRDFFTHELRFEIIYYQVYTHNVDGVIAGAQTWATFMGSLWQGVLGTRPVCDILTKFPPITTDYNFDGVKFSPLKIFSREITEMMARYRVGDGTGASIITPASSCVQDSNQALYVTIKRIEKLVNSNTTSLAHIQRNSETRQVRDFNALVSLGNALEKELTPLGIVRPDWEKNVQNLSGTGEDFSMLTTIIRALTSWRSIFPRRAQDKIAKIFLHHGAALWVLRTNQVGGFDPNIAPSAPMTLLGRFILFK